jgi:hypothetical protein
MVGGLKKPVITSVSDVYAGWTENYVVRIQVDPDSLYKSDVVVTARWPVGAGSSSVSQSLTATEGGLILFNASGPTFGVLQAGTIVKWTVQSVFESDPYEKAVVGLPTGGTIQKIGKDRIHTYRSSGTFVAPTGFGRNMRVLAVAGGGGGAGKEAGGGGAGGMIDTTISVPDGSHAVTVGIGGAGGYGGYKERDKGWNGTNSVFRTLTAIGGGTGGGTARLAAPGNGGSGGGAGHGVAPGQGTAGQGHRGGSYSNTQGSSGGGGAGGVGGDQVGFSRGGHGGPGRYSDISGDNTAYAGGGGGCLNTDYGDSDSLQGKGGVGGGGNSGKGNQVIYAGSPVNGVDGLGGGGGSGGWSGDWFSGQTGGKGGDGIVIIRYTVA